MIEINLLPQEVSGKTAMAPSGPGGGGLLVTLVMMFALLAIVVGGGWVLSQKNDVDRRLAALKADERRLTDERKKLQDNYKQLQEDLETLRDQIAILDVLDPKDRLFWAKKLNILPMFVPDGVFLTKIEMIETVREQETEESRKAYAEWKKKNQKNVPAPKRTMVPVITASLNLTGVSYVADGTSDQRFQLILDFWNALADKQVTVPYGGEQVGFLENMSKVINSSDEVAMTDKIQGREVSKFSFTMNTIPITANIASSTRPK